MDILNILQNQIDGVLLLVGVVLFLIFMTASRLYIVLICFSLFGFLKPSQAFEISISSINSSNIFLSGFETGRVYQVESFSSLSDMNLNRVIGCYSSTSSLPMRFVLGPMVSSVQNRPAGYYNDNPLNPDNTNLVWLSAFTVTNFFRAHAYYRAFDITYDFNILSDQKNFCISVLCGASLFWCYGRAL